MGQYLNIAKRIISQKPTEGKAAYPAPRNNTQKSSFSVTLPGEENCTMAGNVVQLYRMRESCQTAGHCLQLTQETGCNLYPVRLGWCRGRI